MPPAITVTGLHKSYDRRPVVDDLSFEVGEGEVFGLLGPNGAGKTTTVEILEGYRVPDRGEVAVLGLDPIADSAALKPRIGVMLQEGGLYPSLRAGEVLALFAAYYRRPLDPVALLERLGIAEQARTVVRRLSGGQRQALAMATALVGRPRLVFLDEPTAGMDPHARVRTWEIVRELADDGVTVLLTTHGMDEAEKLCDRVAIIDGGRLVALGAPDELGSRADHPDVRFRAAPGLPVDDLAAALHLRVGGVAEERTGEYRIDAPPSPELVADLAVWLRDRDTLLEHLQGGRRSLEEVFLRLTTEDRP
jgi:ABC-2 type transport system ATP-binding protein